MFSMRPAVWLLAMGVVTAIGPARHSVHAEVIIGRGRTDCAGSVAKGLRWLAAQQQRDGSWIATPEPTYKQPASPVSATHSTALAMLAYLGAGQTHHEGPHKEQFQAGLKYLQDQIRESDLLGDLRGGGDMAAHGLATLVLCEAYAMTQDKDLIVPAQLAVRFSERSQNRNTGGWGVQPHERDDMHVFGWQFLALSSGQHARMLLSGQTLARTEDYLDQQQLEQGRAYGRYMPSQDAQATAIGLRSRAGTSQRYVDEAWRDGAKQLLEAGPAEHDVERNFWMTQIARQAGEKAWRKWIEKARPMMVHRQAADFPTRGSWFDPQDVSAEHGRLVQTALNLMCLEVYYRHLPVYRACWPPPKGADVDEPDDLEDLFGADPVPDEPRDEVDDLFGEPGGDPFAE